MKTKIYSAFFFLAMLSSALIFEGVFASDEPVKVEKVEIAKDESANFHFVGRHLIASYYGCDPQALENVKRLPKIMEKAVDASGAHLLKSVEYVFEPNGLTMVLLLSESHASIHTYPEHNACFVDLFTCGNNCSAEKFDKVLQDYLKPTKVNKEIITRE